MGIGKVYVRVLQRNRSSRGCIYRQIYFKELDCVIREVSKSKIYRIGWKAGDTGGANVAIQV